MKSLHSIALAVLLAITTFIAKAQPSDRLINESVLLNTRFYREQVSDAQRNPFYPIAGRTWTLYGFKAPYNAGTGRPIYWGYRNDRFLMFDILPDDYQGYNDLDDDIFQSRRGYRVVLNLFERDGEYVETVSEWGKLIGLGHGGFMYIQENDYGTYFSMRPIRSRRIVYRPDVLELRFLSQFRLDFGFKIYRDPRHHYAPRPVWRHRYESRIKHDRKPENHGKYQGNDRPDHKDHSGYDPRPNPGNQQGQNNRHSTDQRPVDRRDDSVSTSTRSREENRSGNNGSRAQKKEQTQTRNSRSDSGGRNKVASETRSNPEKASRVETRNSRKSTDKKRVKTEERKRQDKRETEKSGRR